MPRDGRAVEIDLSRKLDALRRPDAYADQPRRVEVIETHLSWVFLTDRHAYKLKKPVRYNAVDFRSLAARRANCLEEVRLNRRLAGDVYIGAVPLTVDERGTIRVEGDGDIVDWLVKMRRLPADRMLDSLIARGSVPEADLRAAARLLASFYRSSQPVPIGREEYRARLEHDIRVNLEVLSDPAYGLPEPTVEEVHAAQLDLLRREPELFDRRVVEGRIVEGHGDLRPQHVCLIRPPVIFDCLEFDRNLRIVDAADELSFLAMECERLGAPEIGPILFDVYEPVTGDRPPARLRHFYLAYRAGIWARLALLRTHELEVARWHKWLDRARGYLHLAERYSRELR